MLFYTGNMKGEPASSTTHGISITNTFNVTVVVYNITLSSTSRDMFTVSVIALVVDFYGYFSISSATVFGTADSAAAFGFCLTSVFFGVSHNIFK